MEEQKTKQEEQKMKEKAERLKKLFHMWEEAISNKNLEEIKKYAIEIEELGKEVMKGIWKEVRPGEKISDIVSRILER